MANKYASSAPMQSRRKPSAQGAFRIRCFAVLAACHGASFAASPSDIDRAAGSARVVCRFDFDERAAGNLDEVPMYWDALRPAGFPTFATGRFDESQGNLAVPSFYLASSGRNVAYAYSGPGTRVRVGGSYRVEGFIRPDRLRHGRACLSAHFLDRKGHPILDSTVRSAEIAGDGESAWTRVEIHLPPAPPEAHSISVIVWVVRGEVLSDARPRTHAIPRSDVHGGAWFDDITVYRLPVADLSGNVPGNVMAADDPRRLTVSVLDPDGEALDAQVTISDARGKVVQVEPFSIEAAEAVSEREVTIKALPAGLYHARLELKSGGMLAASRDMDFALLARPAHTAAAAQSFGVVLDQTGDSSASRYAGLVEKRLSLIGRLGVRAVKAPVWPDDASPDHIEATESFLQELNRGNYLVTAMLTSSPNGASVPPSVVAWLNGDAAAWREPLSAIAAPFAGIFRWWQIGGDDEFAVDLLDELAGAAGNLRQALRQFITEPRLAASMPVAQATIAVRQPVEQIVVRVGPEASLDWLPAAVHQLRQSGYSTVSAFVPPLPRGEYAPQARLAEFARRVIAARHAGTDTVWIPQPWHVRRGIHGDVVEPDEEFVLLRGIVDALGDAEPGERVFVAEGVTALAFHAPDRTTLALWDTRSPPSGRVHALPPGNAARLIDILGGVHDVEFDVSGRPHARLSEMPLFVEGVDRGMLQFITSMRLTPEHVEAGKEIVRHTLQLRADREAVTGEGVLEGPSSLEITPRTFSFHVAAGDGASVEFTVRYPHTEPAGRKTFTAKLRVGPSSQYVEIPLFVEIGVSDLDVWGSAVVERGDLVLRHVVSNRSSSVLSFRGSARVPGRERQYRPLANLGPGESQTVEYRFNDGASLIGRHVRLQLAELNDGPRVHTIELRVP